MPPNRKMRSHRESVPHSIHFCGQCRVRHLHRCAACSSSLLSIRAVRCSRRRCVLLTLHTGQSRQRTMAVPQPIPLCTDPPCARLSRLPPFPDRMLRRCSTAIRQRARPASSAPLATAARAFTAAATPVSSPASAPVRAPRVRRPYIAYKPLPQLSLKKMAAAAAPSSASNAMQLREILKKNNIAAYVVPTADAHQVRPHAKQRRPAINLNAHESRRPV